ncbi:importin subunit beta-5 [Coccidioides immitis H538.4]|uniref:Importin subunit beta-5 n=1 Tax=Coccidioides immitis H538.4 TaxID=396776 RepID=A0A0J8RGM7_COCIT|nr:importin subunit beta-5 [Coccidioides immitis H538.4]
MEQQLLQLLSDTQSPAPATRKNAEGRLLGLYTNEHFPLSLASIASHTSVPVPLRQSALLILRTFIVSAWSSQLDEFKGQVLVNDANKVHLRRVLLELAISLEDDRKVKASASYVVSKIASADFPDEWPDLLPTLLQVIPTSNDTQLHGALRVLSDLVETGFSEEQFFKVARELVSTVFNVATNGARKATLRALAVSVFRACFDTLEMVLEQHKAEVKQFMDEALNGWSPFFIATLKEPLPPTPTEEEEASDAQGPTQWRGLIALKLQVVKLGEWLKVTVVKALLAHINVVFSDTTSSWKLREAALYVVNQLLRDFHEVSENIPLDIANGFNNFIQFCIQQDDVFLRARGYLLAGKVSMTAGEGFHQTALSYLEAIVKAISSDSSDVVQVACICALQDLLPNLPQALTMPVQLQMIGTLSDYIASHDLRDMTEGDDLKFTLANAVRDAIMIDPGVVLSSVALDLLFNIASNGASNFQLGMIVTETFEEIVQHIAEQGADAYIRLCEKVLPSLNGAIDIGNLTQESALTNLAVELLRALAENGLEPLPQGLVASVMPKLNRLLLASTEPDLLPPATLAVKHMLAHDPNQFFAWRDPQTGKDGVESALIIISRLLGETVEDSAAAEVGALAGELVEKAGAEKLGPFLPQLLRAVAQRLATAEQAQFIQSLILVFARLSLVSTRDVIDFLAQLDIGGSSGLNVVLSKWLESSVNFVGFDEIRQNVIALAKLYALGDQRISEVQVKGDLIIQDTGRIKTRSQSRLNPDQYTIIPAPLKIIKILVEELSSASGMKGINAAGSVVGTEDLESDDENDDWEDVPSNILDLGLGITKQELMAFGEGDVFRQRDDETQAHLSQFFREEAAKPGFQEIFAALKPEEQDRLRSLGQ